MTPATLKALKASIKHWERLTTGADADIGPKTCALCNKFFKRGCNGCPVKEHTGFGYCDGTPYFAAVANRDVFGFDSVEFRTAALSELRFLERLLP